MGNRITKRRKEELVYHKRYRRQDSWRKEQEEGEKSGNLALKWAVICKEI
jgi:hypothetical protein